MMQHTDRTTPNNDFGRPAAGARRRLHDVIFGIHTPAGRGFDIALISLLLHPMSRDYQKVWFR